MEYFISKWLASKGISDSPEISYGLVVDKLAANQDQIKDCLKKGMKVSNVTSKDVGGIGYTSRIYKCTIELQSLPEEAVKKESISVILKAFSEQRIVAQMKEFFTGSVEEGGDQRIAQMLIGVHNKECEFYARFGQLGLVPLPGIYHLRKLDDPNSELNASRTGLLIMEDLTESAYVDRMEKGLNRHKVENLVRHLARLHAHLICMKEEERAVLLVPFREMLYGSDGLVGEAMLAQMTQSVIDMVPELAEPLMKLRKVLTDDFIDYAFRGIAVEIGIPEVLVHGDLWTQNLLWWNGGNGSEELDELAAIIDWQGAFVGNPMVDLARVLTCSEPEVRRELDSYIVQLYHAELARLMREKGEGKKLTFTLAALRQAFEVTLLNQMAMMSAINLPYIKNVCTASMDLELVSDAERARKDFQFERMKKRILAAAEDGLKLMERLDRSGWGNVENQNK